ncbi:MAG: glycerol-3-phosphate 1-O-acyltransferase PlsY [Anaerolineae bacterium]|nr:glycerol-3-phosphate 1-O-acyltransferase PlsY [Anaerolineae bacterium]
MIEGMSVLATVMVAYLLGSFPAGYLLGRAWGVNVLHWGSGRTGGTNVLRAAGPIAALLTGALDVGKGAVAVWLAGQLAPEGVVAASQVLAGAAVILGHNHSIFLGFRGGAGVGTSLGALGALYWPAAIALAVLLLAIIAISRYASLGSLIVVTLMPIILLALAVMGKLAPAYIFYGLLAWALIVYAHRPNIRRLLQGTERRIGEER